MILGSLIAKLAHCHVDGTDRVVFLVARDGDPFPEGGESGEKGDHDKARDKDVWSLVGPVPLLGEDAGFHIENVDLNRIEEVLSEDGQRSEVDGDRDVCGQALYLLVRREWTDDPDAEGIAQKAPRDKDVWSLTNPLVSKHIEARFSGEYLSKAPHSGQGPATSEGRPGTSAKVRTGLQLSFHNHHLDRGESM